ncbi:MAG: hypothetical protein ACRD0Z_13135 [Acidimicrobiales bacterium]
MSLTEDPEVGREDGFVLLAPGHPVLRTAAEAVLALGDAGYAHLSPPPGLPPTPATLQRRARDRIQVDHGRIDVSAAPAGGYLWVLRVGALVSFHLSLDEVAQELIESWVLEDGTELAVDFAACLAGATLEAGPPPGGGEWSGAGLTEADTIIRELAAARASDLSALRSRRLASQLAVVDDYYERVLESIEERRARAVEDRKPVLVTQADATRVEWARRRAEVTDEMMSAATVKPFRLHVIGVPVWRVCASVRRGDRGYPIDLVFLPLMSAFLSPSCPACGVVAPLVAGKRRLGCRVCDKPEAEANAAGTAGGGGTGVQDARPPPATMKAVPPAKEKVPKLSPPPRGRDEGKRGPAAAPRPGAGGERTSSGRHQGPGRAKARGSGRVTPKGSSGGSVNKTGDGLTRLVWESVLNERALRPRDVVRHSPMEALVRLYGDRGPGLVVGMRESEEPRGFVAESSRGSLAGTAEAVGWVETSSGRELRFHLEWCTDNGRLLAMTAFPLERAGPLLFSKDRYADVMRERLASLLVPPPFSMAPLEEAARLLLRRATEVCSLGFAARCLAAWWYLNELVDASSAPDEDDAVSAVWAAAVETMVARRTGIRATAQAAAARYGCDLMALRAEIKRAQTLVKASPYTGW